MIQNEKWSKWIPIQGLAVKYDLVSLTHDNENGLILTLVDKACDKNKLKVVFPGWIAGYRYSDEAYAYGRIAHYFSRYTASYFCEWTFFKVTDSEYLKYASYMSFGMSDDMAPLTHFVFFTTEFIFEVLAVYEPSFEIIEIE